METAQIEDRNLVHVVRCKDCLYFNPSKCDSNNICAYWSMKNDPRGFCNNGKIDRRKDDGTSF